MPEDSQSFFLETPLPDSGLIALASSCRAGMAPPSEHRACEGWVALRRLDRPLALRGAVRSLGSFPQDRHSGPQRSREL
jgi:hypothetical protein